MLARMSDLHDLNISSASAEYLPFSLVIFGSRIRQNSLDAWAAAAAETSAAMLATCLDSLTKGVAGSTSKVWSWIGAR